MKELLVALFIGGASILISNSSIETELAERNPYAHIELERGTNLIDWENDWGLYTEDVIPDKETAIAVAVAIFDAVKGSSESEFKPQNVCYDEKEEAWIVIFYPDLIEFEDGSVLLGYDCNIAIRKSDGQVLRIWRT